jgi:hypothetical protein
MFYLFCRGDVMDQREKFNLTLYKEKEKEQRKKLEEEMSISHAKKVRLGNILHTLCHIVQDNTSGPPMPYLQRSLHDRSVGQ